MRVVESGRFLTPAGASSARRYLQEKLLSIHGRRSRLRAIAGAIRMNERQLDIDGNTALDLAKAIAPAETSEWVLLRDYASGLRQRSLVFLLSRNGDPHTVVKVRPVSAPGTSLRREADALRSITAMVDEPLRRTLPRVLTIDEHDGHEVLALTALPGRPLDISMQRSLLPRISHGPHLAAAGRWLGAFHAATRRGSRTALHGDFWTRNLLFENSDLVGVVDWECASADGEPWEDVFTLPILFATEAPAWLRQHEPLREFGDAFTGMGRVARVIAGYFSAYASQTGISRTTLRQVFEEYLASQVQRGKNEETLWKTRYRWSAMLRIIRGSRCSVFTR